MSIQVNLSLVEDNPQQVPEEIERINRETLQIIWEASQDIAQQEIELITARYHQYKNEIVYQRQETLNKIEVVNEELASSNKLIGIIKRENKSLKVDLDSKIADLKSADDQVVILREKIEVVEQENQHLSEEMGRLRESNDNMQRRLYESTRIAEQNDSTLKETGEELIITTNNRERLDKELRNSIDEAEEAWQKLKQEERHSAIAEALVQEMRETVKKHEKTIKLVNEEKQDIRSSLTTENKARMELEKKIATLTAHADSQEWAYKEMLSKLEHDLSMTRSEVAGIRKRMITAEAGLEREQKFRESLENKLVANRENKL
ncbi:hypothetical protein QUF74_02965 [Candidatus Halobeggiatoa sp. HSG11]|nr:hypothetical protein [Candidatus Halobeggiatoa sp. HSG11]